MKSRAFITAIFLLLCSAAIAEQSNFMISPPPIPWYEFKKDQLDVKGSLTFASVKGSEGLSLYGGSPSVIGRYAFHNNFALDAGFTYFYLGGKINDNIDIGVNVWSLYPNIEIQPFINDKYNLILFAGINKSWAAVDVWVGDRYYSGSMDLFGTQFGLQGTLKADMLAISPFFLRQSMSGTATAAGTTYDIDTYSINSFGLDLTLIPYNMTLSSIMQQVAASGENSAYKTYIFTLSYDFRWDGLSLPSSEQKKEGEPATTAPTEKKQMPERRSR